MQSYGSARRACGASRPVRCIATAAAPVRPAIGIPFERPVRVLTRARDRSRPSASRSRACSKAIEVDPKYTPALVSLADLMHYSKKSVPRPLHTRQ